MNHLFFLFFVLSLGLFVNTNNAESANDHAISYLAEVQYQSPLNCSGQIPCASSAKRNLTYSYTDCATCSRITGWRQDGLNGKCTPYNEGFN